MKKILTIIATMLFVCIVASCNKQPSPQEVAQFNIDIYDNNIEAVKLALKKFKKLKFWSIDNPLFSEHLYPIHYAIKTNNYEMVKLIAHKENVNVYMTIEYGRIKIPALYYCIANKDSPDIVKLLLDLKADPAALKLKENSNIVHAFAEVNRSVEIWKVIEPYLTKEMMKQKRNGLYTPLMLLVNTQLANKEMDTNDAIYLLQRFIACGSDVHELWELGNVPVYNILSVLISNRANDYLRVLINEMDYIPVVNRDDDYNENWIHIALLFGDWEIVPDLIPHIKDINGKERFGNTVLHYAAAYAAPVEIIKQLLDAGSDKTIKDTDDLTAYDLYLIYNKNPDEEVMSLLKVEE